MASLTLPSLLRTSARSLRRSPNLPAIAPAFARNLSTKHPAGFEPPTEDDLLELRERVQEFTRMVNSSFFFVQFVLIFRAGREISAEVAARTDELNEFPADMWKKLGDAGYALFFFKKLFENKHSRSLMSIRDAVSLELPPTRSMAVWEWAIRPTAW